jgi:DNA-binding transcriptional LysR family regulator
MDRIDALKTFVRVMEMGSFSQVADDLGIGQPAVSKRIALLEQEFRTQLFVRSTRALRPTDDADRILKSAKEILASFDGLTSPVKPKAPHPSGTLRVAVPASYGRHAFRAIFAEYLRRYPEVQLDIRCSEHFADLVGTGTELALRIGALSSSTLIARLVGSVPRLLVAAPDLLERLRVPQFPDHLAQMPTIAFSRLSPPNQWTFESDSGRHVVQIAPVLTCDEADVMTEAALAGLGVAVLPLWCAREHLASGHLVPLLPEYDVPSLPLNLVFPNSRWMSQRARLFRDLLVELAEAPPPD